MKNEALCKLLAYNITCVIHSQCELGIEPIFWPSWKAKSGTCCRWSDRANHVRRSRFRQATTEIAQPLESAGYRIAHLGIRRAVPIYRRDERG
jgi:hypothetical protein